MKTREVLFKRKVMQGELVELEGQEMFILDLEMLGAYHYITSLSLAMNKL